MIDEKTLREKTEASRKSLDVIWGYMCHDDISVDAFGDLEDLVRYIMKNAAGWTDAKENPPDESGRYLVCAKYKDSGIPAEIDVADYDSGEGMWDVFPRTVTKWTRLPIELPDEE